ncbi:MAG: hypothetical protein P4L80_17605, partial [Xanthobacteraceae bacterium]|nr:hypothetical protein [Xanthobacteraceae bacterium]
MDENVLATALRLNEPIAFGRVEPLHSAGSHFLSLSCLVLMRIHHDKPMLSGVSKGRFAIAVQ